jgi:hypothetical protein
MEPKCFRVRERPARRQQSQDLQRDRRDTWRRPLKSKWLLAVNTLQLKRNFEIQFSANVTNSFTADAVFTFPDAGRWRHVVVSSLVLVCGNSFHDSVVNRRLHKPDAREEYEVGVASCRTVRCLYASGSWSHRPWFVSTESATSV